MNAPVKETETFNFEGDELIKFAQIIPRRMMKVLKEAAEEKGISIDIEVASRLLATLIQPGAFNLNILLKQIFIHKFKEEDAIAECNRHHQAALYVFEMEKLRLLLKLEKSLPPNFKETFFLIDVKEASERIRTELEFEDPDYNI